MKKCRRGKGTKFTAILRKSQFSWPGNRKQQVTPLIAAETKWFKSPYVGVVSFNVRKQISLFARFPCREKVNRACLFGLKFEKKVAGYPRFFQESYRASLSSRNDSSEFSTSWWKLRTALYGSTTVSDTLGLGITLKVSIIRSGYLTTNQSSHGNTN